MSTHQLQLWTGKAYEPYTAPGMPDNLATLADDFGLKRWRIVKLDKDRPLKPKYARPRGSSANQSKQAMIDAYLGWAIKKGLTSVAAYANDWRVHSRNAPMTVRRVPVADFLGAAPEPENDE